MAKSLIVNRVSGTNQYINVPTTPANADTFASTFLDGEYVVYEATAPIGSDIVAAAPTKMSVFFSNSTTGDKGSMNIVIPSTKTERDVESTLMSLTLNGVLIDKVYCANQYVLEKF